MSEKEEQKKDIEDNDNIDETINTKKKETTKIFTELMAKRVFCSDFYNSYILNCILYCSSTEQRI